MMAMAHLFDLTHDARYLIHLREFIELALRYRDDHYPGNPDPACRRCEPRPIDDFRHGHVAGWGGVQDGALSISGCPAGGCSGISEALTGIYAYPIAAFARIVAEDPSLHAAYGADALRYANAALETMRALTLLQMDSRQVGNFTEGYLTDVTYRDSFGKPMEYNVNAAFMTMLMELWRALDSPFYRNSAPQPPDVEIARAGIPFFVSRFQRFFSNHLQTWTDTPNGRPRFHWNYGESPASRFAENQHSSVDMRYINMLRHNFDRLNAQVAQAGEPIALDSSVLERFANTFVYKIAEVPWRGDSNLAQNVDGEHRGPDQNNNCKGWVNLAVANPFVYTICRDVTVGVVNGQRGGSPAFSVGMHSEVLMNKQFFREPRPRDDEHEPHCGPNAC
jgi:hypothetical protein